jgi:hypothetical protein
MNRRRYLRLMVGGFAGMVGTGLLTGGSASASARAALQGALEERYGLSTIELERPQQWGAVTRRGVVLSLQTDGVPANPLRVVRPIVRSPRDHAPAWARHLRNYARLTVPGDGAPIWEPAAFTVRRGTRVVVLETKVERDAVRRFTHTVKPVAVPGGQAEYACTEFVFRTDPDVIRRADLATVERTIQRWLARAA